MNSYDYCNSCGRVYDYLDLKPHRLKWYCKSCYKEVLKNDIEEPMLKESQRILYSADYCTKCGKLFDYLELIPHELKWYCKTCYKEMIARVAKLNKQ
ncbi:MAG: hypothetical protein QW416_00600 [Candidatus Nitrosocaldaceae archaeon]